MITREQAYAAYLAMGDRRSLKGLRDQLAEDGVDPPAYSTLRTWSSAGQWRQRAAEHDSGVVVTVEHIMEQKAATRVELSELAEKAAANAKAPPKKGALAVKIQGRRGAAART